LFQLVSRTRYDFRLILLSFHVVVLKLISLFATGCMCCSFLYNRWELIIY
jgi:hypothetical protein